jgi:hypothetical protein
MEPGFLRTLENGCHTKLVSKSLLYIFCDSQTNLVGLDAGVFAMSVRTLVSHS